MTRAVLRSVRLLLALLCGLATLPASAAEPSYPKPLEAAFTAAKGAMLQEPAESLRHVAQAEALARNLSDPRQRAIALATARWLAGEAHLRSNDAAAAGPLLADGLRLIAPIREPIRLRGDLLMSQGTYYMQRDQAAKARDNYQTAYDVFGAAKEPARQAVAYQNLGLLYAAANDNDRAQDYLRQAAGTFDGDPMLSLSLHNNRGNILMVLERYAEAEKEYAAALKNAQALGKPLLVARVLGNLARDQVEARKFDAAQATLAKGFELTQGSDALALRRNLLATEARLAADSGDLPRAAALIRQAFNGLDLSTTGVDLRTAHLYAYRILRASGDDKLALTHLEALKRLNDEAAKVANTTAAALVAARFDDANQRAQIANLRADQARRAAEFQRTLFLSIGAATLLVIALLTFGIVTLRRSRNQVRAANVVLGQTNIALEKALKAKTEFLATTSHEIRTPLNGILGMTQVMLSDPKLPAETRDRIGIVHGAGVTMRSLVDDILDVAKMETGNLTVDAAPLDLCATLRDVTRMWEEQARAKGLEFTLELNDAPHWIVSDAGRLRQIVFNLLSNAIKFTERGSVGVRVIAEGDGDSRRLRMTVTDTGIGIPEDKREEIFESFKQVDAGTTRKFGGTGLGLTICRNLAQALGGDIAVASGDGEGSSFVVDLPLVPAEAPADAGPTGSGVGTMLVFERNPIFRSKLKTQLESHVGALRFAATPDEVLSGIAGGDIAQLVIDEASLKAAGDDPFAILMQLTSAATEIGTESAILWTAPDSEVVARLKGAGVGQVIEKPVTGSALIAALIPHPEQNSHPARSGPLVSRAA